MACPVAISQAARATSVVVLPEPAGRDAQRRSGRRGGGGSLVGREPGEAFGDGRVELHRGQFAGGPLPPRLSSRRCNFTCRVNVGAIVVDVQGGHAAVVHRLPRPLPSVRDSGLNSRPRRRRGSRAERRGNGPRGSPSDPSNGCRSTLVAGVLAAATLVVAPASLAGVAASWPKRHRAGCQLQLGEAARSSTSSTSSSTTCTSCGTTRTSRPTSSRCRTC